MYRSLKRSMMAGAAAGALLLTAAACADRSTAPVAPKQQERVLKFRSSKDEGWMAGQPAPVDLGAVTTFTVDPTQGGLFTLSNGHVIYIPANAICDRATSGYGLETWDTPCTPATAPITITATAMKNGLGMPFVDFQPAMRFAPSDDPAQQVRLYLYSTSAETVDKFQIDYCFADMRCIDEADYDESLATHRAENYPYFFRRLKHFSGYNVAAGFAQTDAADVGSY